MFKYYTWTHESDEFFRGNDLLSRLQIKALLGYLARKQEAFATIQDYDADGNMVGCPLYFDIDSPSLFDAYQDMQAVVSEYDDAMVWFSGSKGFHVIAPIYIRHPRCHEIAGMMARDLPVDVDPIVYRTRSMWRCEGTYNPKGGMFKVMVDPSESLDRMIVRAREGDSYMGKKSMNDIDPGQLKQLADNLPTDIVMAKIQTDFENDMTPCIKKLWDMCEPPDGQRHSLAYIMTRHCHRSGLTQDEAVRVFSTHHFWSTIKPRDYEKIIASVYRTGRDSIGCVNGRDSDMLRQYCSNSCKYNENWMGDFKDVLQEKKEGDESEGGLRHG